MRRRANEGALLLSACVALCFCHPVFALDPTKHLSQFGHRVWTRADGLPQDSIRALAQAADGALWVGTDEGLARFDGVEFTPLRTGAAGLPSSSITALAASRDGSIWVGTLAGVSHFAHGLFVSFDRTHGLGTESVTGLHEAADGTIWVVGGSVVSAIRGGRIVNYSAVDGVPAGGLRRMVQSPDGSLYGAGIGVVVKFDGRRFHTMSADPSIAGNITQAMSLGADGTIWIAGTRGAAAVRSGGSARAYGQADGLTEELVRSILADRDDNVWLGTVKGLARLEQGRVVSMAIPGLSPIVWELLEDRDGSLWVGTNSGLHQFRQQPLSVFGTPEGFPSDLPSVVHQAPDGDLWIGFRDAGVLRMRGARPGRYTSDDGLAADEVFSIRDAPGGGVLVSTRLGLSIIRGQSVTTLRPDDPVGRSMVYDAVADDRGRIWMGTARGVVLAHHGRQVEVVPGGPIIRDAIVAVERSPDGTIWAGSYGNGLWRYANGVAERVGTEDGLEHAAIRVLQYDRANRTLWIGTAGGGLVWYRDGRFARFGSREGLESDNVGQIIDAGESLWVGTTVGLARLQKQPLLDGLFAQVRAHVFVESAGLRSSQCAPSFPTARGGTRDRLGQIWVTTANGVAMLTSPDTWPRAATVPTSITAVLVDGQPVNPVDDITLGAGVRQVEFRYAAVSLLSPERLRYRYQLEGLDDSWIDAGGRRSVTYNRLPPGRYRFSVSASSGGEVHGAAADVRFSRRAVWYEAAWFPYALVLVVAVGAGAAYWERWRRARARFEIILAERNRISRDLHDTLSQHMVGIASQLAGVASALRDDPAAAERHLALARRMAQHSLTDARQSIMDLRSSSLDAKDLLAAIENVSRELAGDRSVALTVSGDPGADLSDHVTQQLLRIAQEGMSNALKHAGASRITVELDRIGSEVWMIIRDDGVGFDPEASPRDAGHFGLLGMRERAQRLRGRLEIASRRGAGTTIEVTVPAHE